MSDKKYGKNRISDRELHRQAVKNVKNGTRPQPILPRHDTKDLSAEDARHRAREKAELNRMRREARMSRRENNRALLAYIGRKIKLYGPKFCFSFICICIIALTIFLVSLYVKDNEKSDMPSEITYTVGEKTVIVKTSAITFDDILYTDFSVIAKMCGMTVSGDISNLKYHTVGDETAVFDSDSEYVTLNGTQIRMTGKAKIIDDDLWVPISFIDRYIEGVSVVISEDKKSLSILQDTITDKDGTTPITAAFLLKNEDPLNGLGNGNIGEHAVTLPGGSLVYVFSNDLSSYYRYMNPSDSAKYLKLINPSVNDDGSFVPDDLTSVVNVLSGKTGVQLDYGAEKALEALFTELYSAGYRNVYISKAYTSYATQKKQYDDYIYRERYWARSHTGSYFSDTAYSVLGKSYIQKTYLDKEVYHLTAADAKRVVLSYYSYPGTGDHQTGLGVDFAIKSSSADFGSTDVYTWLCENAYKFGYIERYPKGKEKITGYSAEAKHWRFVGQVAAAIMHEDDLTLEEYIASIQ